MYKPSVSARQNIPTKVMECVTSSESVGMTSIPNAMLTPHPRKATERKGRADKKENPKYRKKSNCTSRYTRGKGKGGEQLKVGDNRIW